MLKITLTDEQIEWLLALLDDNDIFNPMVADIIKRIEKGRTKKHGRK